MPPTSFSNQAFRRWINNAISGTTDVVFPSTAEGLTLARPEDVIAYVTPGHAERVLGDAKAKFANPSVPDGFSAWKDVLVGERGTSPDYLRLYQTPAFPSYINSMVVKGGLFQEGLRKIEGLPAVRFEDPVIHILHPQCRIYGHFLLEAVLKVPYIQALRSMGYQLRTFIPSGFPRFVKEVLLELLPEDDLVIARDGESYFFKTIISPHFNQGYLLSPVQIAWCSTLFSDRVSIEAKELYSHDKVFLMRKTKNVFRHLGKVDELFYELQKKGFHAVFPETLSLKQQCNLFRRVRIVAGDYSSSMHNMIFSSPGTKLISFNYINSVQTAIGLSRAHKIAYIAPTNTGFIKNTSRSFTEYYVDLDEMKRVLAIINKI